MFKLISAGLLAFVIAFGATFMLRDPAVDMSAYQNVVPEYRAQIKELMVATAILRSPMYRIRHAAALERLEDLANEGVIPEAKDTVFMYYAQPHLFYCMQADKSCKKDVLYFDRERSEKAFHWARQLEGDKKTTALSYLIRDARFAPVATEEDRIYLMTATEANTRTALSAAVALAFHHLDNRYFGNNMMDEASLWLDRASELEQSL